MSNLVINVLMIMVTLVAVTTTYNVIVTNVATLANLQASPEYSCLDLQTSTNQLIQISKSCINSENEIELTLTRSSLNNAEIQELVFTFQSADKTQNAAFSCSEKCGAGVCTIPKKGAQEKYFFSFTPEENPQDFETTKVFLNSCELDEIKITNC